MADQLYWVRTEQGRVWGPYTLGALQRMRGHFTVNCEVSLDNKKWRPGPEVAELKELLAPARKVEKQAVADAAPRISEAMKKAFKLGEKPPAEPEPESEEAPPEEAPAAKPLVTAPPPPPQQPAPVEKPLEVPESGDLAETSPLRLYALAAVTNASGWLQVELEKGRMIQVSFRRGTPDHLSTDEPQISLLRFLQSRGVVSPEKGIAAEEQATKSGQDIVSVLFQMQLIPAAEAHKLLGDYALFLLDRVLATWRGKFTFEKDAPSPPGAFPLGNKWTLLAEAVRRMDPTAIRARLGKKLSRPVVRSGGLGVGKVEELALNAQETRVYSLIDGTNSGDEVLEKQPDAAMALRILHALTELGHLSFAGITEETPVETQKLEQPKAEAPPKAAAAPKQPEPPKRELPKSAREVGRVPPAGPSARPSSPPPVMQAQKPAAPPPAPPPVKSAPAPAMGPPPTFATAPANEPPQAQLKRLQQLFEKLSKVDHFDALGMQRKSASAAEAKRNFFLLARELHPDTVAEVGELKQMKERLFARINEAAQVLTDDKKRKEYEEELDGKASNVDVKRIFAAEENFQRAEIMIKARKYQEGLELLDKAIELNAEEAEFYAWRGYARFLVARDRKAAYEDAAADCKKAIKMVDKCLPAHLFLGHMSKVVGEMKLAERCYHKVLELEPKHVEAQRELRLMGKKA